MKGKLWIGLITALCFNTPLMAQAESASQPSGTMDAITLIVILVFLLLRGLNPR